MAGERKSIGDLTDEQIEALTPEELLELQTGGDPVEGEDGDDGDGSDEGEGEGEGDAGAEGEGGDGEGEGGDESEGEADGESDDGDPPQLTREQLEALANEKDDDEGGDANGMVPRSRLNEVLENQRNLRLILQTALATGAIKPVEQAAPRQEETPAFLSYDFKAKAREQVSALAQGDEDKALALADEIEEMRAAKHAYELAQAREAGKREAAEVVDVRDTKAAIAAVEKAVYATYPFLNGKSKDANEAAILAVNAKAKQLVAKGKPVPEALAEAAEKIGSTFAKMLKPAEKPGEKDAKGDKKPGKDTRTPAALQRNLSVRQPPAQKSGVGNREQTATIDLRTASDEQIERFAKNHPDAYAAMLEGTPK